ncbi:peroxisomal assembly protein [Nowakowskiella sp. JEL0078]|nr:peroxisomal assembly protein [Nowakowskiella sp. JEL0078]
MQTELLQTGIIRSSVPPNAASYFEVGGIFQMTENQYQPQSFKDIEAILSTSLILSSNIHCSVLLHGAQGVGKETMIRTICDRAGVQIIDLNIWELVEDTDKKTKLVLSAKLEKILEMSPCVALLKGLDALTTSPSFESFSTVLSDFIISARNIQKKTGFPVLVFGTMIGDLENLSESLKTSFRHHILIESPNENTRLSILKNLTNQVSISSDVSLRTIASKTAALNARDLESIVSAATENAAKRINNDLEITNQNSAVTESDLVKAGVSILMQDFNSAIDQARKSHSMNIGAPQIPNVSWDDVGGLANVKDAVFETIQLPLQHPELFAEGLKKRSGILFYGPPGTGKTLVAKAIATTFSLNFLSIKGPELLNMYVGESEKNVREVFAKARDASPCVIFFDELDSVAPKRGEKGDSGGVIDRIVSQLLAELDGMSSGGHADVFVVGATNRPDLLDSALLRPGRFDKLLYLGVCETKLQQVNILKALTRKFKLAPNVNLRKIAEICPLNYTGADFYALSSDAMLKAILRTIEIVDKKIAELNKTGPHHPHPHPIIPSYFLELMLSQKLATTPFPNCEDLNLEIQVETSDFEKAQRELIASVSMSDLQEYQNVRKRFERTDTPDTTINRSTTRKDKGKGKAS